jgi:hypothetical protein
MHSRSPVNLRGAGLKRFCFNTPWRGREIEKEKEKDIQTGREREREKEKDATKGLNIEF